VWRTGTGRLLELFVFAILLDTITPAKESPMQSYHLTDESAAIEVEQAILASLMQSPGLYWDLLDLLTPEAFSQETSTWQALTLALEAGQSPRVPTDWTAASDPYATAHRLLDL